MLNDSFGALAISLAGKVNVTESGDSFLTLQGLEKNLARNGLAFDAVPTYRPVNPFRGHSTGAVRVPKTLALLKEQLIRPQWQLTSRAPR